MIVVDTGPLVAIADADDQDHERLTSHSSAAPLEDHTLRLITLERMQVQAVPDD